MGAHQSKIKPKNVATRQSSTSSSTSSRKSQPLPEPPPKQPLPIPTRPLMERERTREIRLSTFEADLDLNQILQTNSIQPTVNHVLHPPDFVVSGISVDSTTSLDSLRTTVFSTISTACSSLSSVTLNSKSHTFGSPLLQNHTRSSSISSTSTLPHTLHIHPPDSDPKSPSAQFKSLLIRADITHDPQLRTVVAQARLQGYGTPVAIHQGFKELLNIAESTNHINAFYLLGLCYYHGLTPDQQKDYNLAYRWISRAAIQGEQHTDPDTMMTVCLSQYCSGYMLSQGQGTAADTAKATDFFQKAATRGHPVAQHIIGWQYENKGDPVKAKEFYSLSAHQNYSGAQASLGVLLIDGIESFAKGAVKEEQVVQEALLWLNRAAAQNHPWAFLKLGTIYAQGIRVTRDVGRALLLYKQAAVNVNSSYYGIAHYMIGSMYRSDQTSLSNLALAVNHLTLAANTNHIQANRILGFMYSQGMGVQKDDLKARTLYKVAASQGDAYALSLLADQAENGRGCKKNVTEALDLYEKAAKGGAYAAVYAKAILLHRMDRRTEAYVWFSKAATSTTAVKNADDRNFLFRARLMLARYHINGWGQSVCDPVGGFKDLLDLAKTGEFWEAHYWIGAGYESGIKNMNNQTVIEPNLKLAFDYYEQGALHGDVDLMHKVARMLANGFTHQSVTIKDQVKAFGWYTKAASEGHPTAQYSLGLYYANGLPPLKKPDIPKAIELYRAASKNGLPDPMISLAQLLIANPSESDSVHKEAIEWLNTAVEMEHPAGLRELAKAYETGLIPSAGENERNATGLELLTRAIKLKDDPLSWCALSRYYENGWAVSPNLDKALVCLKKAESLNHSMATIMIAEIFERKALWDQAWNQYERTVEANILKSALGWKSRIGKARLVLRRKMGTERDRFLVFQWLTEMVSLGPGESSIEPLSLLGMCYEKGMGTPRDVEQAILWYDKALEQPTTVPIHWAQENARFKLSRLLCQEAQYERSLQEFRVLQGILDPMTRYSHETMVQARQVRYYLGYLLLHGIPSDRNISEAKIWLGRAADEGQGSAIYELGLLAISDNDDATAQELFKRGRSMNHPGCIRELGLLWLRENRDEINWNGREVYDLLEEACQLNDQEAYYQLGLIYEFGLGNSKTKINPVRALESYRKAAHQGHEQAAENAARVCERLEQPEEVVVWLTKISHRYYARVVLAAYRIQGKGGISQDALTGLADVHKAVKDLESIDVRTKQETEALGMAYFTIGECHEHGRAVEVDAKVATLWYNKAVQCSENVEAMYRLGNLDSLDGNEESAFEWFLRAATKGNHVDAQYQLGLFHASGLANHSANPIAAKMYFTKAANQGHKEALLCLGNILWQQEEYKEGMRYIDLAAKADVPEALRRLGNLYHQGFHSNSKGFHIEQDYGRALSYFRSAAKLNDCMAALMVGSYYDEGFLRRSALDHESALTWYKKAHRMGAGSFADLAIANLLYTKAENTEDVSQAEQLRSDAFVRFQGASSLKEDTGAYARVMVALYYLNGWKPVEKNEPEGFSQLLAVAKDGGRDAFGKVATCYENGVGVDPSESEALFWWRQAAEFDDDVEAIDRVGYYYTHGLGGLVADPVKAQEHYDRANNFRNGQFESEPSFISSRASMASY
ncbi:hypothetical protein CLU79DRAFT_765442 [Phycomyces nitens]|nr:hypothetical protein CLU79DRAFT_765442 [Phycomyces nitens]